MQKYIRLALPALFLILCACAPAKPGVTGDPARDHFLGKEYGKMTQVPGHPERLAWRKLGVDPKRYTAVLLDKTVVWQATAIARESGVSPEELSALAAYFDQVLAKTMGSIAFPIATEAGPHVMRISTAITWVRPSNPTMNTISSVMPVGMLMTLGRKASGAADPNVGACSMEFRFSDAATGESIGLFADHVEGDKYDTANFEKFGQAEKAMDQWVERMREGILKNWGARKD
ncbi:MAG: DUF3313 domain-containing protein [Humidesulfovibrio sp.]|jgi:hypothetical protein|uniref:DUF3313 domain-containing protein n=1 Tax=Humidesulfovibrio sp. TaxID=2910988 RepID=UPI002736350F|nr:DUF3313 domain-containing protein [Humidesulfovibrio sp.]MDP2848220.1 DUF3313 domain-containing protein [Humidesulfovibrio sp.]